MSLNNVPGISTSTKPSPTTNTKANRLPAPTLFVAPPSRNASQLSLARTGTGFDLKPGRPGVKREKSVRARAYTAGDDGNGNVNSNGEGREQARLRKASDKSVDAKWREMQSTLNDVELTAQSSTHVFGESHAKALDDLRDAQIALARAWGRGNDTQAEAIGSDAGTVVNINRFQGAEDLASERGRTTGPGRRRADTAASASTVLSDESQLTEDSGPSGQSQMEDETAQDVKLASERRAANEAYFKKVDSGVKEVVEKLEKVAEAMRGVEGESRSLWSNSDSSSRASVNTTQAGPAAEPSG